MPPHDLGAYGSDVSLTPPSGSRSVTASPPRTGLTAEQRELKRQRDQARHNSKMQARGRRTDSASSVYSPPVSLADMTSAASNMPVYTTAPSHLPLLTEPSAPQYMPPFSPPLQDQNQAAMFTNSYTSQSYLADYSSYPPSTAPGLPPHYGYVLTPSPHLFNNEAHVLIRVEQQAPCTRSEYGHVPCSSRHSSGPRRQRAGSGGAQPAEAAMLGARVQRAAVLDLQQPS